MDTHLDFGEWFEDLYKREGYIQKELAELLKVDQTTISGWINGTQPRRQSCLAIAELFNLDPVDVLQRAKHRVTPEDRRASERFNASGRAGLAIGSRTAGSVFESDADYMSAAELAEFVTANADKLSPAERRRTAEIVVRFLKTGKGGEELLP